MSHTANTMPTDALATLGASASAGMVLTQKPNILSLASEELMTISQHVQVMAWCYQGNKPFPQSILTKLTHCGLVTPYGDRDLGQHWLR